MEKKRMLEAFRKLDKRLAAPTRIIVGGGAALMAAWDIPVSTQDVDGVPDRTSLEISRFQKEVHAVGRELGIVPNWLNDYFSSFLFVLPSDYGSRLKTIYEGENLVVAALGKEDLILMKCFAGRDKDLPHIRALIRKGSNLKKVDARLQELLEKKIPQARKAADLFDDLCGEMGVTP